VLPSLDSATWLWETFNLVSPRDLGARHLTWKESKSWLLDQKARKEFFLIETWKDPTWKKLESQLLGLDLCCMHCEHTKDSWVGLFNCDNIYAIVPYVFIIMDCRTWALQWRNLKLWILNSSLIWELGWGSSQGNELHDFWNYKYSWATICPKLKESN
jgi:hypothetical protein